MTRYLAGRLGQAILVLWAAYSLSFILLQLLPADAILIKFQNPDLGLSAAQIQEIRVAYGENTPLWQQYLTTLGNMLRGDFGYSVEAGVSVSQLISTNLPPTLRLAGLGFISAIVLAVIISPATSQAGSLF